MIALFGAFIALVLSAIGLLSLAVKIAGAVGDLFVSHDISVIMTIVALWVGIPVALTLTWVIALVVFGALVLLTGGRRRR